MQYLRLRWCGYVERVNNERIPKNNDCPNGSNKERK
jgi:hypothetical protein